MINNVVPRPGVKLQVAGNYDSSIATPQGKLFVRYFVGIGFLQKSGKGDARLCRTVTDIFNTFKIGYIKNKAAFSNYRYGKAATTECILTFAWFFKFALNEKSLENKFATDY